MTTDNKVTDSLVLKTENLTQSTNTGASEARKYSLRSRDKPAQQQNELVSTEKQQDNREKNDNECYYSEARHNDEDCGGRSKTFEASEDFSDSQPGEYASDRPPNVDDIPLPDGDELVVDVISTSTNPSVVQSSGNNQSSSTNKESRKGYSCSVCDKVCQAPSHLAIHFRYSQVDVLIGYGHPSWHPVKSEKAPGGGDLWIHKSIFGVCVGGSHPNVREETLLMRELC